MKFFALLLSFLFAFTYTSRIPVAALEATVTADANGRPNVQAKVPVNKIGALLLADATAILSGDSIEITSNHPTQDNQTLLQGQILQAADAADGIHGIMYFKGGAKLSQLCRKADAERIQTTTGEVLSGSIGTVAADGVDIMLENGSTQHIPCANLKCIDSPCAYEFKLSRDSRRIAFAKCTLPAVVHARPAQQVVHVAGRDNTDKTRKVIMGMVLLAVVATAIAVPIAVACGTHHHHHHNDRDLTELLFLRNRASTNTSSISSTLSNPFFP